MAMALMTFQHQILEPGKFLTKVPISGWIRPRGGSDCGRLNENSSTTHAGECSMRFRLRTLLLAMTSCAIAFGVMARFRPTVLGTLAACVPAVWCGVWLIHCGCAIEHFHIIPLRDMAAALVVTVGMVVIVAVVHIFVILILVGLSTGKWPSS